MSGRIIWLYPRLTTWMGGSRFLFEVLIRLNRVQEVILIVQRENIAITNEFRENGIKVICLNSPSYTEIRFWILFKYYISNDIKSIKALIKSDDIFISSMFPMNYIASKCELPHIQLIYEPFAMFFDVVFQKTHSYALYIFCQVISRLYARYDISSVGQAGELLTLSQFERTNCLRVYSRDSNVIYEGVNVDFFNPKLDSKLNEIYKAKNILFHSTGYDSYKGTDHLIKALPAILLHHPDTLILISQTREDHHKRTLYEKYLLSNQIADKVVFLGFLDYEKLPEYYTLADLYLEPGINRSMSLSSKEANACGTASVRGEIGTEDTVDGLTGILTSSTDTIILAKDIVKLLDDKDLCKKLGNNAREYVMENYSWEVVVDKISESISNLKNKKDVKFE